jgi:phospholipid/cholesterol/gamma-HCH transport system permease protein
MNPVDAKEPQDPKELIIRKKNDGVFALGGNLTIDQIGKAEKQLRSLLKEQPQNLILDGAALEALDTAGAMVLTHLGRDLPQLRFQNFSQDHTSLLGLVKKVDPIEPPIPAPPNPFLSFIENIGRNTVDVFMSAKDILGFFGQATLFFLRSLAHPRHFRAGSLARHIRETGIDAIPIVSLVAFLISVVIAYQGAFQLRPLGAASFTVNLVTVSVLREMAVLLTAIMVAGRSGSAFAAEIGVMKVNEEVDALSMIGIEPFDILVLPRLLALLLTLPLLTFIADIVGLFGGYVTCALTLDISWQQYWEQVRHAIHMSSFTVGIIKAPVFALIIAVVGCRLGMRVSGSAESVGIFTTKSVVQSIFIVLVADALFSILFSQIGW